MNFSNYQFGGFYGELFREHGVLRPGARLLIRKIESLSAEDLLSKQKAAEIMLLHSSKRRWS